VICDLAKIDERGCRGAHEWIIEILSPRSRKKDLTLKCDRYQHHGAPLYRIVPPHDKTVTVLQLDASAHYVASAAQRASGQQPVREYPGPEVDRDRVFTRKLVVSFPRLRLDVAGDVDV
jgi:hypothetical protein